MDTEYLSIGKVAKLKNISIKALRYYDEIGIFPPAYINPKTNYRYYKKEQLPILDAVSLCLKLGIPLKTLPSYANNGTFDFDALLSDTRKLAKEKVHGIQLALDLIKERCGNIKSQQEPVPEVDITPPPQTPLLTTTFKESEYLVSLPLSEDLLPPYDGLVLKLFIFARQRNLILENPSCVLYRHEHNGWQKYLCLRLTPGDKFSPDIIANNLRDTEFALFEIPAGTFTKHLRNKSLDNVLNDSASLLWKVTDGSAKSLLERRLPDSHPDGDYNFELIELNTYKCI